MHSQTITRPSTNRDRCRATTLIKPNALPLSQNRRMTAKICRRFCGVRVEFGRIAYCIKPAFARQAYRKYAR